MRGAPRPNKNGASRFEAPPELVRTQSQEKSQRRKSRAVVRAGVTCAPGPSQVLRIGSRNRLARGRDFSIRFGTVLGDVGLGLLVHRGVLPLLPYDRFGLRLRRRSRLGSVLTAMLVAHAFDRQLAILTCPNLLSWPVVPDPRAPRNDARHDLDVGRRRTSVGRLTRFAFTRLAQADRIFEPAREEGLKLRATFVGPRALAPRAPTRHGTIVVCPTELTAHVAHLLGQRDLGLEVRAPACSPRPKLGIPIDHHRPSAAVNFADRGPLAELCQLRLAELALAPRRTISATASLLPPTLVAAPLRPGTVFDLRLTTPTPRALAAFDRTPNIGRRGRRTASTLALRGRLPIRRDLLGGRPRPRLVAAIDGTGDLPLVDVTEQPARERGESGVDGGRRLRFGRLRFGRLLVPPTPTTTTAAFLRLSLARRVGRAARGFPRRRRRCAALGPGRGGRCFRLGVVRVGQGRRSISRPFCRVHPADGRAREHPARFGLYSRQTSHDRLPHRRRRGRRHLLVRQVAKESLLGQVRSRRCCHRSRGMGCRCPRRRCVARLSPRRPRCGHLLRREERRPESPASGERVGGR